jgi:hypothetical protein
VARHEPTAKVIHIKRGQGPVSFTFGGGNIGVAVENTTGTIHTTSVYFIPIWHIVAVLAAIVFVVWVIRSRSQNSN